MDLIGVDLALIDLLDKGIGWMDFIWALEKAQLLTFVGRGHLVALNDEYVRRRIKRHNDPTVLPKLAVRCLFCSAVATLYDWWRCCGYTYSECDAQIAGMQLLKDRRDTKFLLPCDGPRRANRLLQEHPEAMERYLELGTNPGRLGLAR